MRKFKIHIINIVSVCFAVLFSSVVASAQLTSKVGEVTELSVKEVSGETYLWELYDTAVGVNFAVDTGNCPESKACFVGGQNAAAAVKVSWLEAGEYFYKVTVSTDCSNNIKVGRILITNADTPPTPKINVAYNCKTGIATLTASNYTGDLLWSTGEKTSEIKVSEEGEYSLVQILNKQQSAKATVTVAEINAGKPVDVVAVPPQIEEGGVSQLSAKGCSKGKLRWYADKGLTEEIDPSQVSPMQTTTYYVVCESAAGCLSEAVPVTVSVESFDDKKCKEIYKNITIKQLVTSNGDGYNDNWDLQDLLEYCKECGKTANVKLFNRWGAKVYEKSGYMLDEERFDGHAQGSYRYRPHDLLPSGTYFYIITVEGEKVKTGFINFIAEGL